MAELLEHAEAKIINKVVAPIDKAMPKGWRWAFIYWCDDDERTWMTSPPDDSIAEAKRRLGNNPYG